MPNLNENFLKLINNNTPINNSKPIKIREIKGAICQLKTPISTKVYSNGSIGYNLLIPENINMTPNAEHKIINSTFLIIKIQVKKKRSSNEKRLNNLIINYFNSQSSVVVTPLSVSVVLKQNNLASFFKVLL